MNSHFVPGHWIHPLTYSNVSKTLSIRIYHQALPVRLSDALLDSHLARDTLASHHP